jgi:hypothetical protein
MTINILDKLHESGELRELVQSGIISSKVIYWMRVYHSYHTQVEGGTQKTQAVYNVADIFGIQERMVYRILQILKK